MKFLAISVFSLAVSCLLPFTKGEVDRYIVHIEEKGTRFSQEVDVDVKQNVEIYRVPAHNDIDGTDFYHDFKMRVTVSRILSRKVCYVAKMDSSLSSPEKLKTDLEQAALQPGKLPVTTKSYLVMVTGPANRLLLTKEILDFCGALPIYNTEVQPWDPDVNNGTSHTIIQTGRRRRQTGTTTVEEGFISCLRLAKKKNMAYVEKCMDANHWNLRCKMMRGDCFYQVTCIKKELKLFWECKEVHLRYSNPACCDFICP